MWYFFYYSYTLLVPDIEKEKIMTEKLKVNGKRLQESLEKMATFGATPKGGVQRLALSDEDKMARESASKMDEGNQSGSKD